MPSIDEVRSVQKGGAVAQLLVDQFPVPPFNEINLKCSSSTHLWRCAEIRAYPLGNSVLLSEE